MVRAIRLEVEQVVGIEMVADWYVYGEVHRRGRRSPRRSRSAMT